MPAQPASATPPHAASPAPPRRPLPTSRPAAFLRGLVYAFSGAGLLLRSPEARKAALVPAAINAAVLLIAGVATVFFLDDLYRLLMPDSFESGTAAAAAAAADPAWWRPVARLGLALLAGLGAFVLAAASSVLVALLVAAVIAGPFNELLSETVERVARPDAPAEGPLSIARLSRDAARAVATALQRLLLFLVIYVPLLLLSFVPVLGLVAAAAALVYTVFFLALNFTDPTLDRRRLGLSQKLAVARRASSAWLGFGSGILLVTFVPLLPLLLSPALVAGGTLFILDLEAGEPS
jgi:CysZ protein